MKRMRVTTILLLTGIAVQAQATPPPYVPRQPPVVPQAPPVLWHPPPSLTPEVAIWLTQMEAKCKETLDPNLCTSTRPTSASDVQFSQCDTTCRAGAQTAAENVVEKAYMACSEKFVNGNNTPVCTLEVPPAAKWTPEQIANITKSCTESCRKDGPKHREMDRMLKRADAIVLDYKRCMMGVDSRLETRKAEAYDTQLYADIMLKAHDTCHARGCDKLEALTDLKCWYGRQ